MRRHEVGRRAPEVAEVKRAVKQRYARPFPPNDAGGAERGKRGTLADHTSWLQRGGVAGGVEEGGGTELRAAS